MTDNSSNVVIIGGSGGIGRAFVEMMAEREDVNTVLSTFHRVQPDYEHSKVTWYPLDITDESAIQAWSQQLGEVDWLINAAGLLHAQEHHPEKSIRHLDPEFFLQNIKTNTLPTLMLARHLHAHFRHGRPARFATVSARVGSIEDNRLGGWYSYRVSKAALNMAIKTLAIEWQRTLPHVVVAALHPGTTDTALSKPYQKNVPREQLFTPEYSVTCMLEVLGKLTPADSGKFWAFDGELLPW
jgi:NAD(P)-dependent dehydrogenase (short-subunit alcohol dehydrogenase family)